MIFNLCNIRRWRDVTRDIIREVGILQVQAVMNTQNSYVLFVIGTESPDMICTKRTSPDSHALKQIAPSASCTSMREYIVSNFLSFFQFSKKFAKDSELLTCILLTVCCANHGGSGPPSCCTAHGDKRSITSVSVWSL